ncbi:MAG: glutamate ABC transporter substrate-binding protein [Acidipropionibacterium jensenii]|nr:glutamate ABC transporter substrate-binding protein [Acidipropionibacterium jensenii]MDN6429517.1 glutamate ABC transporter substrate-binding protein [Propionibacterium sp.]MDN6794066.1 glutamate ABC transporter substrate-binding protein [Propionibacterium sp.]
MRLKGFLAAAAAAATALSLAACSSGSPASGESGAANEGGSASEFPVASNVELTDSPTFDAMKSAGKVRVGVKEDQPGLGYLDAVTGERSGFDIDVARWIAAELGFSTDQIEFQKIPSANREQALINGDIDYYVGTYSITDKRKDQVGFAGPYFVTGQGLLVKADNTDITSDKDLAGKTVCSATGSTPIQNIKDNYPDTKTTEFDTYSQCVEALKDGSVDAVTTDQAILIGYAAQEPDALKVVGEPFSVEKYGVGVPKDDAALRHFINKVFTDGGATWTKIYDATLGASGTKVEQPAVDDYE